MLHELVRPPLDAPAAPAQTSTPQTASERPTRTAAPTPRGGLLLVGVMAAAWAAAFGWLAVQRHLAGGSNAEDLGFTDQVLSNFLRGQWFRMSIYQGATWNTEVDISRLARPDSLLAFHFEPMLLLLVPLYALGGGAALLLVVQAVALAAGAVPAYRLGRHATGAAPAGVALACAYLLSPLGQWAVLSDFHTSTLAAPLLLVAVERLVVGRSTAQSLAAAGLAATAREDVGLALAVLGLLLLSRRPWRTAGAGLLGIGVGATILAGVVMRVYSGGVVPFDVRYAQTLGTGLGASLAALERPIVLDDARTVLLSGGWLGLVSPLALLPAVPTLALNALSSSPWMAAGKAHYSGLVLPFVVVGAAAGLNRLKTQPGLCHLTCAAVVLTSFTAHALEGAGPLGGNYAPATVTDHARTAAAIADSLPPEAVISASSALVPRVSRRPRVYVFPAVLDAEYVFVDLRASPAPTSAGDVFLHIRSLLGDGGWNVESAADGLLLLHRGSDAPPLEPADFSTVLANGHNPAANATAGNSFDTRVSLISADLVPSLTGAVDVDGPHWILRTVWRARQPLPVGTHLDVWLDLRDGRQVQVGDVASLWWNPPERWTPDQSVTVDVPDVPVRQFLAWRATFSQ